MASDTPRYRLLEPIGRGRIGKILLAEAIDPGTRPALAAVALLDPRLTSSSEELALLREQAALLGKLEHPTIARVLDLSRFPEGWGLVMEYARGLDLDLYRIAGPLPPRVAAEILEKTATALRAALELPLPGDDQPLGLCHGDLVPSLVRVDARGVVKVCGFGLSAQDGPDPQYAAPERLHGEATPRADVYSLALIAVRLLSGRDLPPPPGLPTAQRDFVAGALDAVQQRLNADLKGGNRYSVEPLLMMLEAMLDADPARRPSAQRVQLGCRSLLGVLPGAWLEPWAAQRVPELYERAVEFARLHDPSLDPHATPDEPDEDEAQMEPRGDDGEEDHFGPSTPVADEEPEGTLEPEVEPEAVFEPEDGGEEDDSEPGAAQADEEPEGALEPAPSDAMATLPGVSVEESDEGQDESAQVPECEDEIEGEIEPEEGGEEDDSEPGAAEADEEPEGALDPAPSDAMATLPGIASEESEAPAAEVEEPAVEDVEPLSGDAIEDVEDVSEHLEDSVPELDAAGLEPLDELPASALAEVTPEPEPAVAPPVPDKPEVATPAVPVEPAPTKPARAPAPATPEPKRSAAPWWALGFIALVVLTVIALWMGGLLGGGSGPADQPAPQEPAATAPPTPAPVAVPSPEPEEPAPAEEPRPAAQPVPAAGPAATPAPAPAAAPRERTPRPAPVTPTPAPTPAAVPDEPPAPAPAAAPEEPPAPSPSPEEPPAPSPAPEEPPAPAAVPEEPPASTPAPVEAVAPVEAPAPAPVEPPAPAAAGGSATVHLEGDATKVLLQAGGGSFPVGQVPAGTYNISAWFGGDAPVPAGTLQVAAGEEATLRCSSMMLRCSKQ